MTRILQHSPQTRSPSDGVEQWMTHSRRQWTRARDAVWLIERERHVTRRGVSASRCTVRLSHGLMSNEGSLRTSTG